MGEVAERERQKDVPHVATFSAVRMRFVDDILLRKLAELHAAAPSNGADTALCQVGGVFACCAGG